jgi:hypothetical protein
MVFELLCAFKFQITKEQECVEWRQATLNNWHTLELTFCYNVTLSYQSPARGMNVVAVIEIVCCDGDDRAKAVNR